MAILSKVGARLYPGGNPAKAFGAGPWWWNHSEAPYVNNTGQLVTEETAVGLTSVYRACAMISGRVAGLTRHISRMGPDGDMVPAESAGNEYLWRRPNEEMTAFTFWQTMLYNKLVHGNAFMWVKTGPPLGYPVAIYPLQPWRIWVQRDPESGQKLYAIDGGSIVSTDYEAGGNIIHVMGMSNDGVTGASPLTKLAQVIGLGLALQDYAARLFSQGTMLSGVIETDKKMEPAEARELGNRFSRAHAGPQRFHGTAVLDNGAKWNRVSVTPEESQALESRSFQVVEIARMFGIPPYLLGDVEKSTSWGTGIEEQHRNYVTHTLAEHLSAFENAVSDELLDPKDTFSWDVIPLMQGKLTDMALAVSQFVNAGYDPSDVIRVLGLRPMRHTGVLPSTLQHDPSASAAGAEGN